MGENMRKTLGSFFVILGLGLIIWGFKEDIDTFIYKVFIVGRVDISVLAPNEYYRDKDYIYVQTTEDFIVKDKQHLLNVYYTAINSGQESFTFMCDRDYVDCLDDIAVLSSSQIELSNINSFVHPYNSFDSIETEFDTLGKVVIKINKIYSDAEISLINDKVNQIIDSKLKNVSDAKAVIKIIHDYIINNTKYDSDRSDNNIVKYKSDTAYGALLQGYGLCGGYTDAVALFLDHYDIPNFKVISDDHVWNAVYLDGKWYHLDLTWDDPVSKSGKDYLEYNFYLISTDELLEKEKEQHNFDFIVFREMV